MSDELLKRLETGHDKECAMSYGMHEHCCDCSYPARQEAAARVRELEAERSAMIDNVRFARERAERAKAERDALWEAINLIPEPLLRPEFYGETDWGRAILKLKEQA